MKKITKIDLKTLNGPNGMRWDYVEINQNSCSVKLCYKDGLTFHDEISNSNKIFANNAKNYEEWYDIINTFKGYRSYSKEELKETQAIILSAYVRLLVDLEEAIEKSESKNILDQIKNKLLILRKRLIHITTHIDCYDDLLEDYKNT